MGVFGTEHICLFWGSGGSTLDFLLRPLTTTFVDEERKPIRGTPREPLRKPEGPPPKGVPLRRPEGPPVAPYEGVEGWSTLSSVVVFRGQHGRASCLERFLTVVAFGGATVNWSGERNLGCETSRCSVDETFGVVSCGRFLLHMRKMRLFFESGAIFPGPPTTAEGKVPPCLSTIKFGETPRPTAAPPKKAKHLTSPF